MSIVTWAKALLASDTFNRAEKTFVQAFLAQVVVAQGADRKTIVVSASAAGISAVWNAYVAPALAKRSSPGNHRA